MNVWQCDRKSCGITATGAGGAIGLRAIGWWVALLPDVAPIILCPAHRPATEHCSDPSTPERMKSMVPCSSCSAATEAKGWQDLIVLRGTP